MAKDAKGHGSSSRGGSYQNIDKNLKGPGRHVGYANGPWQISKLGAGYLATHSQTGESFRGDSLGHVSDQLAARTLSSGSPKSDTVPVHDSMSKPQIGTPEFQTQLVKHHQDLGAKMAAEGRDYAHVRGVISIMSPAMKAHVLSGYRAKRAG